ncbi:hypothetical protein VCHA53O466_50102 [Vibrio chagasii]|nr:hypothetical protein VCHA53O466_50102 [Vibrio chagasii]
MANTSSSSGVAFRSDSIEKFKGILSELNSRQGIKASSSFDAVAGRHPELLPQSGLLNAISSSFNTFDTTS